MKTRIRNNGFVDKLVKSIVVELKQVNNCRLIKLPVTYKFKLYSEIINQKRKKQQDKKNAKKQKIDRNCHGGRKPPSNDSDNKNTSIDNNRRFFTDEHGITNVYNLNGNCNYY